MKVNRVNWKFQRPDFISPKKKREKDLFQFGNVADLEISSPSFLVAKFATPIDKLENSNMNSDLHNIMGELEKLKSYLNNVELQLYEANERISDLLETVSDEWWFPHRQTMKTFFFNLSQTNRSKNWRQKTWI